MPYPTMPILFPNSKFRHYRIKVDTFNFLKIKKKIYKPEQLKEELDKIPNIQGVYQTISLWLNPEHLGKKHVEEGIKLTLSQKIKNLQDNFFLSCNYLMDFDRKDYDSEKSMLENVERAKELLWEMGMRKLVLQQTPHRGRQLIALDFDKWANVNVAYPKDREYAYGMKLRRLTNILLTGLPNPSKEQVNEAKKKPFIFWDYNVSLNTRSLFRTPNTVGDNGVRVKLIEYPENEMIFAR